MDCHNVSFGTGYEIFDKDGTLVKSSFDSACSGQPDTQVEGELEVQIKNEKGEVVSEVNQPMRSFVKGFMYFLNSGARFGKGAPGVPGDGGCSIGGSDMPTQIGDTYLRSVANSNVVYFDTLSATSDISKDSNTIVVTIDQTMRYRGSATYIMKEIGLFNSRDTGSVAYIMYARDVVPQVGLISNDFIRMLYKFKFPYSNTKSITMNWVKNMCSNINGRTCVTTQGQELATFSKTQSGSSDFDKQATFTAAKYCDIEVGTGSSLVSPEDIALTPLQNESSLLEKRATNYYNIYAASNPSVEIVGNRTARYVMSRDFKNKGNAPIHLTEAGLLSKLTPSTAGDRGITAPTSDSYILLARWLLDDLTLERDQTLRVYFQPQVTC